MLLFSFRFLPVVATLQRGKYIHTHTRQELASNFLFGFFIHFAVWYLKECVGAVFRIFLLLWIKGGYQMYICLTQQTYNFLWFLFAHSGFYNPKTFFHSFFILRSHSHSPRACNVQYLLYDKRTKTETLTFLWDAQQHTFTGLLHQRRYIRFGSRMVVVVFAYHIFE